jgi:hypothetical protein
VGETGEIGAVKSILTIECIKLTEDDTEELGYDAIEVDGWLYEFCPLPGSLFEYELQSDGIENLVAMLFESSEALHAEMQKIIEDGKFHHCRHGNHYVIHIVTDEDNWTGPGEWNVEISYVGLLDCSKL